MFLFNNCFEGLDFSMITTLLVPVYIHSHFFLPSLGCSDGVLFVCLGGKLFLCVCIYLFWQTKPSLALTRSDTCSESMSEPVHGNVYKLKPAVDGFP